MFEQQKIKSGFTLIEVMVSLAIMALFATLAWQAISSFADIRKVNSGQVEDNYVLQTALNQWGVDLNSAVNVSPATPAVDYNGKVLRIIRLNRAGNSNGFLVVAWMVKDSAEGKALFRWQSPVFYHLNKLNDAWASAEAWAQTPTSTTVDYETKIIAADKANFYFYLNNAWANPQSRGAIDAKTTIPDGVRFILTFAENTSFSGQITKDWYHSVSNG